MTYQFTPVMSSVVETSLKRFLHSLRSVGMTSGLFYIEKETLEVLSLRMVNVD